MPNSTRLISAEKINIPFSKPTNLGNAFCYPQYRQETNSVTTLENNLHDARNQLLEVTRADHLELVHSCTAALEIAIMALDLGPGDEVIMPSFTFPSTANAVALRGATPVFVDICCEDLNVKPDAIAEAITARTKAVLVVHYAGCAADLSSIQEITKANGLFLIEDSAQCIGSTYLGQHLGTFGSFGAISFHNTKNLNCGHGGALLLKGDTHTEKVSFIANKGTNRDAFLQKKVSKYDWVEIGSSYLLSELNATFLVPQLKALDDITSSRLASWNYYFNKIADLNCNKIRLPNPRAGASHNGHIFYFLVNEPGKRDKVIEKLALRGISATSHFQPLHSSKAGRKYGRAHKTLAETTRCANSIVRLPLWHGISQKEQDWVIDSLDKILSSV